MRFKSSMAVLFLFTVFAALLSSCGGKKEDNLPNIEFGANLLENASFEIWPDSLPAGWVGKVHSEADSGSVKIVNTIVRTDKFASDGSYSCYFLGDDDTNYWITITQTVPVIPGYDLVISADVKSVGLRKNKAMGTMAEMYAIFLDEDGKRIKDSGRYADLRTRPCVGNVDWDNRLEKARVPEGARYAEVGLVSAMSGSMYFDNVKAYIRDNPPWVKKETKFIDFYWLPGKALPDSSIAREVEMIEDYARILGMDKPDKKIKYYYYSNEEDFKEINLTDKYFQGAKWEQREIHTIKETEDLVVTHMLLYGYGFPPVPLAKGAVFYLRAFKHDWDPHMEVKDDLINYRTPALYRTVDNRVFEKFSPDIIVPAWASFSTYLIERHGLEKFLDFYVDCDGVTALDEFERIFKENYEEDFRDADMRWRLFVMRYQPDKESEQSQ